MTSGLKTGQVYSFTVNSVNAIGAGPDSEVITVRVASAPSKMQPPTRVTSAKVEGPPDTAAVTLAWAVQDTWSTGGAPIEGFKLFSYKVSDFADIPALGECTLEYDGSSSPNLVEFSVD